MILIGAAKSPLFHSSTGRIYLIPTESTCQSHKAQAHIPLHNSLNLLDLNPTTTHHTHQLRLTRVHLHITYALIWSVLHPVKHASLGLFTALLWLSAEQIFAFKIAQELCKSIAFTPLNVNRHVHHQRSHTVQALRASWCPDGEWYQDSFTFQLGLLLPTQLSHLK